MTRLEIGGHWPSVYVMDGRQTLVAAVTAMLLATAQSAVAQPEAFVLLEAPDTCSAPCAGTVLDVRLEPPAVLSSRSVPYGGDMRTPYVTPDGRFIVWLDRSGASPQLVLHDRVSGATAALPTSVTTTGFLGNPAGAEIYLSDSAGVAPVALSAAGTRTLASPGCLSVVWRGVSHDGRRGAFECGGHGLVVADLGTGSSLAVLAASGSAALSRDGSAAYTTDRDTAGLLLRRHDVASGTVTAQVALPVPSMLQPVESVATVSVDPRNGRVVVQGKGLYIFDGQTLAVVDSRLVPGYAQYGGAGAAMDAIRSRLYVSASAAFEPFFTPYYSLHVFDSERLVPLLSVDLPAPASVVGAPVPPAPVALQTSITGSLVSLAWAAGGATPLATHYVLEAGSAPGQADIISGLDLGTRVAFSANGVPPGRYYVRMRAGNHAGLGAPSNDVVVLVP